MGTEEYKEHARKRNGVEGIPSILRRRYRIDKMPVRGLVRTKTFFGFKIGAINIKRVIKATFNLVFVICLRASEIYQRIFSSYLILHQFTTFEQQKKQAFPKSGILCFQTKRTYRGKLAWKHYTKQQW